MPNNTNSRAQRSTRSPLRMSDSDSDSDSDRTRTGLGQKKSKSSKIKKFIMKQFDKTNVMIAEIDLKLEDLTYRKQPDSDSDNDDADMVVQGCPRRMSKTEDSDDNDVDKGDCTGKDDCRCFRCESYRQQDTDEDEDEEKDENEVVVEKASRVSRVRHYDDDDSSDDDDDSDDSDDGSDDDSDWTDEDFED